MSDSATLWTAAHQAPLSTGFSRQGYWSGWPFSSPFLSKCGPISWKALLGPSGDLLVSHPCSRFCGCSCHRPPSQSSQLLYSSNVLSLDFLITTPNGCVWPLCISLTSSLESPSDSSFWCSGGGRSLQGADRLKHRDRESGVGANWSKQEHQSLSPPHLAPHFPEESLQSFLHVLST